MLIGLDVGGTHVDVVLIEKCKLLDKVKVPTQPDNLLESVLSGLSLILERVPPEKVKRVVLSTTLGTNAIIQGKISPVGVIVVSGPGIDPEEFSVGDFFIPVSGYVDHRGREVRPINRTEILDAADRIEKAGIRQLAVVGKFSVRNPTQELAIRDLLKDRFEYISLGHLISGNLNFPRRVATAYLNSAVQPIHMDFFNSVSESLARHGLTRTPFILKADGGTLALDASLEQPVQSILSGPAASITGALLDPPESHATAVLDIGGTTTDMAILVNQVPLFEPLGIKIEQYQTLVRSFRTASVGIGGDSLVRVENGDIKIGPERIGPAMAHGGTNPTPTDAIVALGLSNQGNRNAAFQGVKKIAKYLNISPDQAAGKIFEKTCSCILQALDSMVDEINTKPVYTIKELLTGYTLEVKTLLLIGGPAPYFAPKLREMSGLEVVVAENSEVTNAIGAACARTTCAITAFADTERGILVVPEMDYEGKIPQTFTKQEVIGKAYELLRKKALELGCHEEDMEMELVEQLEFNMVRSFYTTGRNIRVKVQIKPGIIRE